MPRKEEHFYPEEAGKDLFKMYDDFYKEAREIQKNCPINILVGMEIEWLPSGDELEKLKLKYEFDLLVGSVHHVDTVPIDFNLEYLIKIETRLGGTEQLFIRYFDIQYEMLVNVKPLVVGHFDLIRMYRHDFPLSQAVWERINRNIDFIKSYDGLVELNSRGWKKPFQSAYPINDILLVMISKGIKFTLSDDSHGPDDVGLYYDQLIALIREFGIEKIHYPYRTNGRVEVREILSCDLKINN
ncbi:histidinolphosphatase [Boothiomyces macroporosus]|uniref:Histidinol-phosphatase n=1 Tax=Boothiomyces macroporosus TaxID=261099 RepID=A0AAD5UKD2_9FUNG|nr:histidinolphosphatase [Boothiomyces macroporosus]